MATCPNAENDSDVEYYSSKDVSELNTYFKTLLDLVPSSMFFDASDSQKIVAHRNKQDEMLAKEPHKKNSKRVKYDPEAPQTTTQLQKIVPTLPEPNGDTEDEAPSPTPQSKKVHPSKSHRANGILSAKTKAAVTIVNSDESESDSEAERKEAKSRKRKRKLLNDSASSDKVTPSETDEDRSGEASGSEMVQSRPNPEQLREKLRARIAELQSKRQKGMTPEEFLESKRLRRKESKLKLKQKRKEAKKLKLSVEKQKKNTESKANGVSRVEPGQAAKTNGAGLVFSKFQFSEQARKPKETKQKKPKSYKELYMKVTQDKEKLEQLKKVDSEKGQRVEEKQAWKKAMEMSKGNKVKDNPELLKKSIKREEKLKQRSQKKWQERVDGVAELQNKRQEKRKKNIQARKQSKVDKKIKLAKKKGRLVSGF